MGVFLQDKTPMQLYCATNRTEKEQLARCALCLHWRCDKHRFPRTQVKFDQQNRARGGMECVCNELEECNHRIGKNRDALGPGVGVSSPERGKGKDKGKGLTETGSSKGKHKAEKGKGDAQGKGKHNVKGKPENRSY